MCIHDAAAQLLHRCLQRTLWEESWLTIVFYTNKTPPKPNNEYSRRSREGVRGGLSDQRTDHNAHTQHHTRLLYNGVSAGNNTAAGAQRRGQAGTKLHRNHI